MQITRMTVRRWMLAIAIVALLLGAKRLAERRAYFLMRAEVEADRADDYVKRRVCLDFLKGEYDRERVYTKLGDHYLGLRESIGSLRIDRGYRLSPTRSDPHTNCGSGEAEDRALESGIQERGYLPWEPHHDRSSRLDRHHHETDSGRRVELRSVSPSVRPVDAPDSPGHARGRVTRPRPGSGCRFRSTAWNLLLHVSVHGHCVHNRGYGFDGSVHEAI